MNKALFPAVICLALALFTLGSCQTAKKEENATPAKPSVSDVQDLAKQTLLGSKLLSEVGSLLSAEDVKGYHLASQNALENLKTGEKLEWLNEKTTHSGVISPSRYYQTTQGNYCREFTQTLKLKQKQLETSGTACRNDKKNWVLQE
jgi:surface antigen